MPSGRTLNAGRASIELSLSEDGRVERALKTMEGKLRRFGESLSHIGDRMFALGGAMAAPFAASIKAASDAQESLSRFEQVFGAQASAAAEFADTLAKEVGRSSVAIKDGLSSFQGFFVGLGFGADEARKLSQQMQTLSIDFASFNNLSDEEAMQRFISALSGSSEVLDKFGVNIKVAALEQEALAQGIDKSMSEMSEMEKTMLRVSVISKAMGAQGAIGDAVRTSDSFANTMKRLKATMEETAVTVGTALIPAATELLHRVAAVAKSIGEWSSQNTQTIISMAKFAAGTLATGAALSALGRVIQGVTAASKALRATWILLAANPVLAALTALGGALAIVSMRYNEASTAAREFNDALKLQVEKNDEARKLDQLRLERLKQLSQQQTLSNEETAEAAKLAGQLNGAYDGLNVAVNEQTGAITGLADATKALLAVQQEQVALELEKQLKALTKAREEAHREFSSEATLFGIGPRVSNRVIESEREQLDAYDRQIQAVQKRLEQLRGGENVTAATVSVEQQAQAAGITPEPSTAEQIIALEAKLRNTPDVLPTTDMEAEAESAGEKSGGAFVDAFKAAAQSAYRRGADIVGTALDELVDAKTRVDEAISAAQEAQEEQQAAIQERMEPVSAFDTRLFAQQVGRGGEDGMREMARAVRDAEQEANQQTSLQKRMVSLLEQLLDKPGGIPLT